jgi:predicted RNA-binding Zn-ribbon protein involved in translation (DUF1610 family)
MKITDVVEINPMRPREVVYECGNCGLLCPRDGLIRLSPSFVTSSHPVYACPLCYGSVIICESSAVEKQAKIQQIIDRHKG